VLKAWSRASKDHSLLGMRDHVGKRTVNRKRKENRNLGFRA